jgi:glycosyltransferase involved in cell wall biosynthesis
MVFVSSKIASKPSVLRKKAFNNPLMVVYAGSFADKDGVTDLIDGFNTFSKQYKEAQLILVGKSAQQLLYKEKYKNRDNIVFKGFIPDDEFYLLLREADILCMCRTESDFANAGFPFKLGEYLATGNPVICTKVSDVEIYLTDNDGYLIQPNSPHQISDALTDIVSNPGEAMKKGLNGLQKCLKHFSPEGNGELLLEVIKNV